MEYSDYAAQGQAQVMAALEEKLSVQQWREADELTKIIMIKTSNHKEGNFISLDIESFPSDVIEKIDELWKKNSNSYFGFSVQKSIYDRKNYQQFITDVGWHKENSWLNYADLFFWETALKGHLPYCGWHFWQAVYTGSSSGNSSSLHQNHSHRPHYHQPHRNSHSGDNAAGAAVAATAMAAVPWLLGAAVVGGAGYLIYREVTKEERKRQERLEREAEKKREEQRRLEEENRVQKNIKSLFALI